MDQEKIISAFKEFLSSLKNPIDKKEMITIINIVYNDMKKKPKGSKTEDKPKREPSEYNKFMTENMAILKETDEGKQMNAKEKMQHIAKMWASKKKNVNDEKEVEQVKEEEKQDIEEPAKKTGQTPRKPLAVKKSAKTSGEE